MADNRNDGMDPWVRLAAEKIREKYLRSAALPDSSRLHSRVMDKVDDALFWLDVSDGPDGFIGVRHFRQTLQRKLTEYAQRSGETDQTAIRTRVNALLQRLDGFPENGRIERDRLEAAISGELRDILNSHPQLISEIRDVSGEQLGTLRATQLMDGVIENYRRQTPAK